MTKSSVDQRTVFDFRAMAQHVELRATTGSQTLPWFATSYQEPEVFFGELFEHFSLRTQNSTKSRLGEYFDFYQDLVTRNVGQDLTAFIWYDSAGTKRMLSFDELHRRSSILGAHWIELGVGQGDCVCIVAPVVDDYVVALMTAFRLGLIVSVLEPRGRTFLRNRLAALAPDFVACTSA
ncbi:uncharacterized protein METZ01_LOCUS446964, partial [marine metagenome]